jgi:hypothetical protein
MNNPLKYFIDTESNTCYKVNYEYEIVTRLGAKGITHHKFSELETLDKVEAFNKLQKDKWVSRLNEYYRTHRFEWYYNNRLFETVDTPFSEKQLQENVDPALRKEFPYHQYLGFHNGEVWAICMGGYLPTVQLGRIDNKGKVIRKWTNVNNVKNFQ